MRGRESRKEARKHFFFEKKKQKTLPRWPRSVVHARCQTGRSLFASFSSEKEDSSFLAFLLAALLAATPAAACNPAGLHVAPGGHDDASGDARHPFATPARALREGGRLVTLAPGTYRLDAPLPVGTDGVTLRACPAGMAVLDGGGRLPLLLDLDGARGVRLLDLSLRGTAANGVAVRVRRGGGSLLSGLRVRAAGTGVLLEGSAGNTVRGSRIADVVTGVELKDGSDRNLVSGNVLEDLHNRDTAGGGVFLHGGDDDRIEGNLVRRARGMGIGVLNWDAGTINLRTVVRGNVVRDVDREATDSGAIYLLGRSGRDTGAVVEGNLVEDAGPPLAHTVGIYLDDSTSGVRVHGNVLRRQGQIALQVHGGRGNRISGNRIELGRDTRTAVLFQAAPADTHPSGDMSGNLVSGNVVTATGPSRRPFLSLDGGRPLIRGNRYLSPPGTALLMTPPLADTRPRRGALP